MGTLSDQIERYLKRMLAKTAEGTIEIRRGDLADRFSCVPSQINYVLTTRFTTDRGYFVESRRGGGGFIRIVRVQSHYVPIWQNLYRRIGRYLTEAESEQWLQRLLDLGLITEQSMTTIRTTLRKETSWLDPPLRDVLRASMFKMMLVVVAREADTAFE